MPNAVIKVKNNHETWVGQKETRHVRGQRTTKILGLETGIYNNSRVEKIIGNQDVTISGNDSLKIGSNKDIKISKNHDLTIIGSNSILINSNRKETINGNSSETYLSDFTSVIQGGVKQTNDSDLTSITIGDFNSEINGNCTSTIGSNYSNTVLGGNYTNNVNGGIKSISTLGNLDYKSLGDHTNSAPISILFGTSFNAVAGGNVNIKAPVTLVSDFLFDIDLYKKKEYKGNFALSVALIYKQSIILNKARYIAKLEGTGIKHEIKKHESADQAFLITAKVAEDGKYDFKVE
ncbi:hypothetical protein KUM_1239 [Taylorella asinigenitalis 14/45]|uniref:Gp5/Type VI secretion system Vgr C-terminal trimerisation domain-containing protein n=1 Tax=Taylorella asinigenitalis 14/45 TaxID=1091495 RepID=I7JNE4_9BURK|nr:hypothetical protein [Taylorella asinigenitalis]CCG20020.1 hypothetical protein KUM_1239 [Taylorella asinigenitalis 14/45]